MQKSIPNSRYYMAIFHFRLDRRELVCFALSWFPVFIAMTYTGTGAKRKGPADSLHYFFSSCAFLPFPHATARFVLARAFLWLYSKLGTDVDLNLFFSTKNLSPVESDCETTALHAASEIPPNFNSPSCVLKAVLLPLSFSNDFLSPRASSKLPPLFSSPRLGPSASHCLHIAASLCGTFASNWHQCMRAAPCTCCHSEQISCSSVPCDLWFVS